MPAFAANGSYPALRPLAEQQALRLLAEAWEAAFQAGSDVWQFALQLSALRGDGVVDTTLRRLIAMGEVRHGFETTLPRARRRRIRLQRNMRFSEASCFVLSEAGWAAHRSLVPRSPVVPPCPRFVQGPHGKRELQFHESVVKRFAALAKNQELVLQAFEEQGWPARVDDPIPPKAGSNCKRRLRDTISRLNRCQRARCMRFHGDGSGQGICWESVPSTDRQQTANTSKLDKPGSARKTRNRTRGR
jgi:hypothetical protein